MRIAVVSHSLIHDRQAWFWDYVSSQAGVVLKQIYPRRWDDLKRKWGYEVRGEGNLYDFEFQSDALREIEAFKPNLIYVQNEVKCRVTQQMWRVAGRLGCKIAVFVWENIHPYEDESSYVAHLTSQRHQAQRHQALLSSINLVVCGNREAEELVQPWNKNTFRGLQVGVPTHVFQPKHFPFNGTPEYDIIFLGRPTPEKGADVLKQAVEGTGWKVWWPNPEKRISYSDLPPYYCNAKVLAAPSIDTAYWKEQAPGGYVSLEALSCGLRVVTSDSTAMVEGLKDCPGVWFSKQNDADSLKRCLTEALQDWEPNLDGRRWVEGKYGYGAVTGELLGAFRERGWL